MKEEWKSIKGYKGLYEVSNLGNVRSLYGFHSIVLKPQDNGIGYLRVALFKKGKVKQKLVHRLVAEAFIPNPKKYKEINHINEDKADNRACNLQWCTRKFNCNYGLRIKKISFRLKKPVVVYSSDGVLIGAILGMKEASKKYHVPMKKLANLIASGELSPDDKYFSHGLMEFEYKQKASPKALE